MKKIVKRLLLMLFLIFFIPLAILSIDSTVFDSKGNHYVKYLKLKHLSHMIYPATVDKQVQYTRLGFQKEKYPYMALVYYVNTVDKRENGLCYFKDLSVNYQYYRDEINKTIHPKKKWYNPDFFKVYVINTRNTENFEIGHVTIRKGETLHAKGRWVINKGLYPIMGEKNVLSSKNEFDFSLTNEDIANVNCE